MKKIEILRKITSIAELAQLLGYKTSSLSYLLFKIPDSQKYRHFEIPKRSGGTRLISAPHPRLKKLQKKVSNLLNDCLKEIEADHSSPAHGFKPERSIFTNGASHIGRRHVFNLDIEKFFPSIHYGRISGYFEKSEHFKLNPNIARALANIVCYQSSLPQGAPSSPVMSNLISRMMDIQLARLAKINRLSYTRYADDITFSTNLKKFPSNVAESNGTHDWRVGEKLNSIIKANGFSVNPKKTRMLYKSSRQEVTGLVVNDRVTIPVNYRRWARAAVSHLIKNGLYFELPEKNFIGPLQNTHAAGSLSRLEGCLAHIYSAHRFNRERQKQKNKNLDKESNLHSDEIVFQKFLYYTKFFLTEKPKIICEGETDYIYLEHAISALQKSYPLLINENIPKGEKNRFKINFANHTEVAGRLLHLSGGTGTLKNFCSKYVERTRQFLAGKPSNPIIVVVDADKSGIDVINYAKGIAKNQKINSTDGDGYVFVRPNLFVVKIPADGKESFSMENLFPEHLLNSKIGEKKLTLSNKKANNDEYGKMYFAKNVVPTAKEQDFIKFKPLLEIFNKIIKDFAA